MKFYPKLVKEMNDTLISCRTMFIFSLIYFSHSCIVFSSVVTLVAKSCSDVAVDDFGTSVSSVTRNLQQLSVENDERVLPSEGYAPAVVIPDHLQVQNADCSHLSFGSFGSAISAAYSSGTTTSVPVGTILEEPVSEADISSVGNLDTRYCVSIITGFGTYALFGVFHLTSRIFRNLYSTILAEVLSIMLMILLEMLLMVVCSIELVQVQRTMNLLFHNQKS